MLMSFKCVIGQINNKNLWTNGNETKEDGIGYFS